jgi:hypothetical protein
MGGTIQINSNWIKLFTPNGSELGRGKAKGNSLYIMDMSIQKKLVTMAGTMGGDREGRTWEEWHRAMGHIAPQSLKTMMEQGCCCTLSCYPAVA